MRPRVESGGCPNCSYQPDSSASRSIELTSSTATAALADVYCTGPAQCAEACREYLAGGGLPGRKSWSAASAGARTHGAMMPDRTVSVAQKDRAW